MKIAVFAFFLFFGSIHSCSAIGVVQNEERPLRRPLAPACQYTAVGTKIKTKVDRTVGSEPSPRILTPSLLDLGKQQLYRRGATTGKLMGVGGHSFAMGTQVGAARGMLTKAEKFTGTGVSAPRRGCSVQKRGKVARAANTGSPVHCCEAENAHFSHIITN